MKNMMFNGSFIDSRCTVKDHMVELLQELNQMNLDDERLPACCRVDANDTVVGQLDETMQKVLIVREKYRIEIKEVAEKIGDFLACIEHESKNGSKPLLEEYRIKAKRLISTMWGLMVYYNNARGDSDIPAADLLRDPIFLSLTGEYVSDYGKAVEV